MEKNFLVPIWEKVTLTIDEAAAYSNIGINRISNMLNSPFCPFVYYVGTKRLVKRKEFEKYLEKTSEFDMKNLFRTKKGADSCPISILFDFESITHCTVFIMIVQVHC